MKIKIFIFLIIISFSRCKEKKNTATNFVQNDSKIENTIIQNIVTKPVKTYKTEIAYLKKYSKENGYNQEVSFMIDYSVHSGKNRFFIVDLKNDSIKNRALVCHGSCNGDNINNKDFADKFSNVSESLCSTLGMAVISERDYSSWGNNYKYWIDGLEKSNENMRKRVVVLHAWEGVPDEEIYPNTLAMSWGCPTVSLDFLDILDTILKENEKVLLYSFK